MRVTALLLLVAVAVEALDPSPVHLIRRAGRLPDNWYREQADLWRRQLDDDPDDARGWYSLYVATEYGARGDAQQAGLQSVLSDMERHASGSWELPYLRARSETDRTRKVTFLEEALARCGDCGEVLEDLAMQCELAGRRDDADRLWRRLYDSAALAPGLLDYNHNLLQSVGDGAILITGGDNDTFPAWMLQSVHDVRADVLVLNLLLADAFRDDLLRLLHAHGVAISPRTLPGDLPRGDMAAFLAGLVDAIDAAAPDVPVYVALTVGAGLREPLAPLIGLTGLAARVGPVGPEELRGNLEQRFRFDSLLHDWYTETHVSTRPIVRRLNGNYAYPMLALAQTLESADPAGARRWRDRALRVARDSGDAHLVEHVHTRAEPR